MGLLPAAAGRGLAWKSVGEMLELHAAGQQVDGKHIKTHWNTGAMALRNLAQISCGHLAEQALLVGVDLGFGRGTVAGGAGFYLEKDQRVAIPGDQVEVAGEALRAPAAADNGVAEPSQMEEGFLLAALADNEMRRLGAFGRAARSYPLQCAIYPAFQAQQQG